MSAPLLIFGLFGLILAASYAIAYWLAKHAPWRDEDEELQDIHVQQLQLSKEVLARESLARGGKP